MKFSEMRKWMQDVENFYTSDHGGEPLRQEDLEELRWSGDTVDSTGKTISIIVGGEPGDVHQVFAYGEDGKIQCIDYDFVSED